MSFSEYLASTRNRDKVMGIVQFLPMMLSGPAQALGMQGFSEGLLKASQLADGYRAVTRLSGLVDMLDPRKIAGLSTIRDPILRRLSAIEFVFTVGFFPCEHIALAGTFGVIKGDGVPRFSGLAVFCWFWSLTVHALRVLYEMLLEYPYISPKARDAASLKRNADFQRKIIDLVKTLSWWVFALTCFPAKGKPQLLTKPAGVLLPLHRAVEIISPSALSLSTTLRGLLGMIAMTCDFMI